MRLPFAKSNDERPTPKAQSFQTQSQPPNPQEIDFTTLSKNALIEQERLQKHLMLSRNPNVTAEENRKIRIHAEENLRIVTQLLQQKEREEEQAQKTANTQFMQEAITQNLNDIRYCINPSQMLNMPYGMDISCCDWIKPTGTKITFKATVPCVENGHRFVKAESFEFDLLSINADKFKMILLQHFKHEIFRVGNQRISIMVC